ncbi:MAG TPA: tetratricopeptide repeat protein [Terriglobales bacterium]|nr:tetratricopeptide repeat protein [Terriglobales bacterium]
MRKNLVAIALLAALGALSFSRPAAAEDKGILALQQSVSLLMSQVADLQRTLNTSLGMMQGLVTQNTDTVNKLSAAVDGIQRALNGTQVVSAQHQSDISKQFGSLSATISELQAHLQRMDETLKQIHQMQQTIPPPTAPAAGAAPADAAAGDSGAPAASSTSLQLYQTALLDFQKNSPAALGELASFIRNYPNDPQVPDAMYYLGTIFMQKTQYNEAIDRFSQVVEQYPDSPKAQLAELNKGICLARLGNRTAAISELRALKKNYAGTEAARQADIELRSLLRVR